MVLYVPHYIAHTMWSPSPAYVLQAQRALVDGHMGGSRRGGAVGVVMGHLLGRRPSEDVGTTGNPPGNILVLTTAAVVHTKYRSGTLLTEEGS